MAWYLLGREYAAQGKEGKAAYCFAQSGEIYEAFERQKIVVDGPLRSLHSEALIKEAGALQGNKPKRKSKLIMLLAMLVFISIPASIDIAKDKISLSAKSTASAPSTPTNVISSVTLQEESSKPRLHFSEGDWGVMLQRLLSASGGAAGDSVIMDAPKSGDGNWIQWNKAVRPLIAIEYQSVGGNTAALKYYNSEICACQAADSSSLVPAIDSWMQDREQAIVLQSAVQAYQQKTGVLPNEVELLLKPYPDNHLPGISPEMKSIFPQIIEKLQGQSLSGTIVGTKNASDVNNQKLSSAGQDTSVKFQAKASTDPFRKPLEIVIDTEKHQLALVSGSYIIRSYPVGLGGEKTPQGEFMISEKVRNPNGKSTGEFGSRGMTLSDTLYAIHGTNKPSSIGKDESHGCVRMLQADVEELYDMVPMQTKVTIVRGVLPEPNGEGKEGSGNGAGKGNPSRAFKLPLQTDDSNPKKTYKWLD
ncbi:L,D-transpeptidase [Paenibacillus sedimenti]